MLASLFSTCNVVVPHVSLCIAYEDTRPREHTPEPALSFPILNPPTLGHVVFLGGHSSFRHLWDEEKMIRSSVAFGKAVRNI